MKKTTFIYLRLFFFILLPSEIMAQTGAWTTLPSASVYLDMRKGAACWSIGTNGYYCGGMGYTDTCCSNLVEYNTVTNVWNEKGILPSTGRVYASGFSIGTKGYITCGRNDSIDYNDLWQWDQETDSWTQYASLPDSARNSGTAFSYGGKGYYGLGKVGTTSTQFDDFWEYDPILNAWTAKATFPGGARCNPVSFVIGSKAYVGTGLAGFTKESDLWEYDFSTDTWTAKTSLPADGRYGAVGYSLAGKGYVISGYTSGDTYSGQAWEYNPSTDLWTAKTSYITGRIDAYAFEAGGSLYIGGGYSFSTSYLSNFLKYEPNKYVSANFFQNYDTVGIGNSVDFTNNSSFGAYSYIWKVNHVSFATTTNASYSFPSVGDYTITLVAVHDTSSDSTSRIVTVEPGGWASRADYGGLPRKGAGGFVIGSHSYVGTGADGTYFYSDFWSWDSQTDTWAQIADFPGPKRIYATGFSLNGNGYLALGEASFGTHYNDLWKYDTLSNSWTEKANFPGAARDRALSFTIAGQAYVCNGTDNYYYYTDHYRYDPTLDSWTAVADFPGPGTADGVAAAFGNKGYVANVDHWYQYDPVSNSWVQKASFPYPYLYGGAFVLGSRIYVGNSPCYAYCTYNDKWIPRNAPSTGYGGNLAYSINGRGYSTMGTDGGTDYNKHIQYNPNNCGISAGFYSTVTDVAVGAPISFCPEFSDFKPTYTFTWQDDGVTFRTTSATGYGTFDYSFGTVGTHHITFIVSDGSCSDTSVHAINVVPAGEWVQKDTLTGLSRGGATTFTIGTNMYVGCGGNEDSYLYLHDFWKYDQTTDSWTQEAYVPGLGRGYAFGFSINDKGYLGTGVSKGPPNIYNSDFYEYDTLLNIWNTKASLPGGGRSGAFAFSIGGKGYAGGGEDLSDIIKSDFYEYDPVADTWTAKALLPAPKRYVSAFVVNGGGMICGGGSTGLDEYDCWKYSPVTNTWVKRRKAPYEVWANGYFSINNRGYIFDGSYPTWKYGPLNSNVFYEYDDSLDRWTSQTPLAPYRMSPTCGSIGAYGYAGMGGDDLEGTMKDLWQYNPNAALLTGSTIPSAGISCSPNDTASCGSSIYLNATPYGGASYQWFLNGEPVSSSGGSVYYPTVSGNYSVSITTSAGSDTSSNLFISFILPPTPTITLTTGGTVLSASSADSYQWYLNGIIIPGAIFQNYTIASSGLYTVQITGLGCTVTSAPYNVPEVTTGIHNRDANNAISIYPNPINDKIIVSFQLYEPEHVVIKIYTAQGNLLSTLDYDELAAGAVVLDISDRLPTNLKAGTYFIEVHAGTQTFVQKIVKT